MADSSCSSRLTRRTFSSASGFRTSPSSSRRFSHRATASMRWPPCSRWLEPDLSLLADRPRGSVHPLSHAGSDAQLELLGPARGVDHRVVEIVGGNAEVDRVSVVRVEQGGEAFSSSSSGVVLVE